MKTIKYKKYNYIGTMHLSNTGGLGVIDIDDNYITYQYVSGDTVSRKARAELRYKSNGDIYFISHGRKINLNEIIRVQ